MKVPCQALSAVRPEQLYGPISGRPAVPGSMPRAQVHTYGRLAAATALHTTEHFGERLVFVPVRKQFRREQHSRTTGPATHFETAFRPVHEAL